MSKLLDYLGLQQFLNKLKTQFVTALGTSGKHLTWTKNGETSNITVPYSTIANKASTIPFAIIDSNSTSTLLTATTISGGVVLEDGACCIVYNNVVASASGCTINIDNLGAKPMYTINSSGTLVTTQLVKAQTFLLIYRSALNSGNGGWRLGILLNTNTTYSAITADAIRTGTATTARTVTAAVLAEAYNISNGTITIGANSITPITQHQDISGKEDKTNKVTSLSSSSTDTQYPSAKLVYDKLATKQDAQTIVEATCYYGAVIGGQHEGELYNFTTTTNSTTVYSKIRTNKDVYLRLDIIDDSETEITLILGSLFFKGFVNYYSADYLASSAIFYQLITYDPSINLPKIRIIKHEGTTLTVYEEGLETTANKITSISSSSTDTQYPSAKCVYDAINNVNPRISITNHGTSDTTFTLTPNIYHKWGSVSSLTLTLGTPADNTIVNEYMFEFTSGSTATTLSLPSSVKWAESCGTLSVEASKTYQISIVDNIGLWTSISNS